MAINSVGLDSSVYGDYTTPTEDVKDKTSLSNDDFMKLLLTELQYQDPTEPTDTEQILTQTSQLATLEATDNTNKALADLAASLSASNDFSTIAAIGKTADLGSNAIGHDKGSTTSFEVYFPDAIAEGTVEILDGDGNVVSTMPVEENSAGVYQFDWDGTLSDGTSAESGLYYVTASYTNSTGEAKTTRMGAYPIESVRFDNGSTLVKLGSNYVPLENVKEVY
ncbi:FlgD immunoglobulin-like domain containing protein [Sulfurimonas sp.]|uniref:FlgD immunoglobulin-like domain containing protein n=1 Tax=Sulfurimonas sp. TaxID=2022749 RepID=UPI00263857D5|nr:FlgD immunoglobulin-like domain containing protein [Sulfurimonas sp.]